MSCRRDHGDLDPLTRHWLRSDSFPNSLSSLSDAEKVIIWMKWPLNLAASATAFCLLPPTLDKESNTESLPSRWTEFRANLGLCPGVRWNAHALSFSFTFLSPFTLPLDSPYLATTAWTRPILRPQPVSANQPIRLRPGRRAPRQYTHRCVKRCMQRVNMVLKIQLHKTMVKHSNGFWGNSGETCNA
jgi:hypothetical protein